MNTKHFLFSAALLLPLICLAQSPSFTDASSLLPSGTASDHAIAVVDMNGDGKDDIIRMQSSGNGPGANIQTIYIAFQQEPMSMFSEMDMGYMDVAGTGSADAWGLSVGDYDQNGRNDLSTGGFYNGVYVFMADADNSEYEASIYLLDEIYVQAMSTFDIDNDGLLDIFVCDDVETSQILTNMGGGVFSELSSGLVPETDTQSDNSGNYGSCFMDVDNNGFCDLYIAKCRQGVTNPNDARRINLLFMNNGDGTWTSEGADRGVALGAQSWSADFGDYDNDGDMDLFVGNHDVFSDFLVNDGTGHFEEMTVEAELEGQFPFLVIQSTWADFNNDGFMDIIAMGNNSHAIAINDGDGTFTIFDNLFDNFPTNSYALGDLNSDGFVDLYTTANGYGGWGNELWDDRIYLNDGNTNNYFNVELVGVQSNINGIGARVEIVGPWGTQIRDVKAGESYGINNSFIQHFGLGAESSIPELHVYWPSGTHDIFTGFFANNQVTIVEGTGVSTGLSHLSFNNVVTLSPNPAQNQVLLNVDRFQELQGKNLTLNILDTSGRSIMKERITSAQQTITLRGLTAGTYLYTLVADQAVLSAGKLIKE